MKGQKRNTPWMFGDKNPAKRKEVREKIKKKATGRVFTKTARSNVARGHWKGGRAETERRIEIKKAGRVRPDKCEICLAPTSSLKKRLHFDHDHQSGKFRGWICESCNFALGHAKDNVEVLAKMIIYLNNNKDVRAVEKTG
jgi:hypothetical protein